MLESMSRHWFRHYHERSLVNTVLAIQEVLLDLRRHHFVLVLAFMRQSCLCSPGCPGTHFIDHTNLELTEILLLQLIVMI